MRIERQLSDVSPAKVVKMIQFDFDIFTFLFNFSYFNIYWIKDMVVLLYFSFSIMRTITTPYISQSNILSVFRPWGVKMILNEGSNICTLLHRPNLPDTTIFLFIKNITNYFSICILLHTGQMFWAYSFVIPIFNYILYVMI